MVEAFAFLALAGAFLLFASLCVCSALAAYCFGSGLLDVGYRTRSKGRCHG